MNHFNELYIISAKTSTKDRTLELRQDLKACNVKFKEVIGVYKSEEEVSFVCVSSGPRDILFYELLMEKYEQECILFSNMFRESELVYPSGVREYIGRLVCVPKSEAVKLDCYTYCSELNK
jgi:hypothetical protein